MNIAECKRKLVELEKRKEEIYTVHLKRIDDEIASLKNSIKNLCLHHSDMLIVRTISHEDEYGKHIKAWDRIHVECTICGENRDASQASLINNRISYQELFNMTIEQAHGLK